MKSSESWEKAKQPQKRMSQGRKNIEAQRKQGPLARVGMESGRAC